MSKEYDGKDKVLFWPDGTWHRCDEMHPDATEQAIHDNGRDYSILWFPEELDDEALDIEVHDVLATYLNKV